MNVDRRAFSQVRSDSHVGAATTALLEKRKYHVIRKQLRSRVAILRAESYSHDLEQISLWFGSVPARRPWEDRPPETQPRRFHLRKPHQQRILSSFRLLPMLSTTRCEDVLIGEGPGHQRDTELVLLESGFAEELRQQRVPFG